MSSQKEGISNNENILPFYRDINTEAAHTKYRNHTPIRSIEEQDKELLYTLKVTSKLGVPFVCENKEKTSINTQLSDNSRNRTSIYGNTELYRSIECEICK